MRNSDPSKTRLKASFTQTLDRAVFATYFVGAILPLLLFAVVTQRFALPALAHDSASAWSLIGALMVVGLSSLASFLFLRRLVHRALGQMNADNKRLGQILQASRTLSAAPHAHVVAESAAHCALDLTAAHAAYVFLESNSEKTLAMCESAGDGAQASFAANEAELLDLVEQARDSGEVATLRSGSTQGGVVQTQIRSAAAMPLSAEGGPMGVVLVTHTEAEPDLGPAEIDALATLAGLVSVSLMTADLQDAQRNFFTHVTELLVSALDTHMQRRQGHASRVAQLANRLGREIQLTDDRMQRLHFSALLHDIGMLRIPSSQQGNLAKTRLHPVHGHRMLSRIRLWSAVAPIVLHHHEHFDGSGLPEGLSGQEIPLEARVIQVVDAYDLLVRAENEGESQSPTAALTQLREEAGSRFDPEILAAFAGLVERGDLSPS
jgi:HD-GYP domain-containing protein (c-di-GMP phosphodiesterase class II)